MTAPDHRPFLLATDLRAAGDAICELIRMSDEEGAYTRKEGLAIRRACYDLLARLDRERRQACRRGSFVDLPELARLRRKRKFAVKRLWNYAVEDIDSLRRGHVERALAFRAAARQS